MFDKKDLEAFVKTTKDRYDVQCLNCHDITIYSKASGHGWCIVSNYQDGSCYVLHRHHRRYPYHRQRDISGRWSFGSLEEAVISIQEHDDWWVNNHNNKKG